MKFLMPLLLLSVSANAHTYFVSNAGSDENSGSRNSPFQTLKKINTLRLHAGDSVLFRCGDVFYGELSVTASGSALQPLVFAAYGSGPQPVLTGFSPVAAWTALGGGIWESTTAVSTLPDLNMLLIDGRSFAMGRYPNATAPNKGYRTITSHNASTSITDTDLPATPNWSGARLVLRTNHFILDTTTILTHASHTLTYTDAPYKEPGDGYGYFIENHPATLDAYGEWYFNSRTKKLRLFFGSENPDAHRVQVATLNNPVRCYNADYVTFHNIAITGASTFGVYLYSARGFTIKNCTIRFCGDMGIRAQQYDNIDFTAENNLISDIGNFGISLRGAGDHQTIRGNTVKNIGLFPGMGGTGPQSRTAIANNCARNHLIEANRVDSTGYAGIKFSGDEVTVKNNIVSNFTLVLDDGGGIYTSNQVGQEKTGRRILQNLVYNGTGAREGTPSQVVQQSSGIYIDDNSSGIEIARNSVWNCAKTGLFVHNAYNLNIHHNTLYNNKLQLLLVHDNPKYPDLRNITVTQNLLASDQPKQNLLHIYTREDAISNFGAVDSNYYVGTLAAALLQTTTGLYQKGKQQKRKFTLQNWNTETAYDAHAIFTTGLAPENTRFEVNKTTDALQVNIGSAKYVDVQNRVYKSSVTLAPYSTVLLFKARGKQ